MSWKPAMLYSEARNEPPQKLNITALDSEIAKVRCWREVVNQAGGELKIVVVKMAREPACRVAVLC